MPSDPNASAHARTRNDHAAETAEDYVEAVAELIEANGSCRVKDLAERFGVTHVTVINIVQRLTRDGLLTTEPYQPIDLTEPGRELAERCRARHETVYRFLRALGLSEQTAHVDAEGIEHHVSPETLLKFREIADRGGL